MRNAPYFPPSTPESMVGMSPPSSDGASGEEPRPPGSRGDGAIGDLGFENTIRVVPVPIAALAAARAAKDSRYPEPLAPAGD